MSQQQQQLESLDTLKAEMDASPSAPSAMGDTTEGYYEVRHAVSGDQIADSYDPEREVDAIVLPGQRFGAADRSYGPGEVFKVTMGEVAAHPQALRLHSEHLIEQARAKALAPKVQEAEEKREALRRMHADQFNSSLPREQQQKLEQLRQDHAAREGHQERRLREETAVAAVAAQESLISQRKQHWAAAVSGLDEEAAAQLRPIIDAEFARHQQQLERLRAAVAAVRQPPARPTGAAAGPGASPAAPPAGGGRPVRERLRELQELMQDGLITPEIFDARQREIVRDL